MPQDKTINSFFLEFGSAREDGQRVFEYFEDLMKGFEISPARSDLFTILEIAGCLGNRELIERLFEADGPVTTSNVRDRLRTKCRFGCCIEKEVEFAALHFEDVNADSLDAVDISVLESILSSDSLRLASEDSLLDFILSVGSGSECLFRYLRSEYLSCERIPELLDFLSGSEGDPLIWSFLCRRIAVAVCARHWLRQAKSTMVLMFYSGSPLSSTRVRR
jgi:hypothetical protein